MPTYGCDRSRFGIDTSRFHDATNRPMRKSDSIDVNNDSALWASKTKGRNNTVTNAST